MCLDVDIYPPVFWNWLLLAGENQLCTSSISIFKDITMELEKDYDGSIYFMKMSKMLQIRASLFRHLAYQHATT